MSNSIDDLNIGDWVSTEDGVGQIIHIRPIYDNQFIKFPSYQIEEKSKFDVVKYIFVIKYFLDDKQKILKNTKIDRTTRVNKIDDNSKILKMISKNMEIYHNYKLFDRWYDLVLFAEFQFKIHKNDVESIKNNLESFKTTINHSSFVMSKFNEFLVNCESKLILEDNENYSVYEDAEDKRLNKILIIRFFTTENFKVVNKEVCLEKFSHFWR